MHCLVTSLICRGYWFYVCGRIPEGKDATAIDRKLIQKYDCNNSKSTRWRRKKNGFANVRYFRWNDFFVLIATKGQHLFFEEEADVKDIRKIPLKVGGYSISFRRDGSPRFRKTQQHRVHVRIGDREYQELLARFEHYCTQLSAKKLAAELYQIPFEGYAPVRRQLCRLLRLVNKRRRRSGLSQLPSTCLHLRRR